MPKAPLPLLKKTEKNELHFLGDGVWELRTPNDPPIKYNISDVRISLVWRARCFASEEEKARWHAQSQATLQLDAVLDKLVADLRKRGRLTADAPRPRPLELAEMLLSEYARYPIANVEQAIIPLNYCMLPQVAPSWLQPLLAPVLQLLCDR